MMAWKLDTKYKLSGWQMLKEENAELLIDGKRVDSDYTFTADSEKMTVEIAFTVLMVQLLVVRTLLPLRNCTI